jgi:hypothetical protein
MSTSVRAAICEHLRADTGAGQLMELATEVYPKAAPKSSAVHPFVVVRALRAPRGLYAFQGLAGEESRYVVTAVTEGVSSATASDMKLRIRTRLHNAPLTVSGYTVGLVSWMEDVEFTETDDDGKQYQHEGCIFEIWAEPN